MAVTINADTSNGLVMTPDTSGEIKLQSAGADIATVTSSGITMASGKGLAATGHVLQVVHFSNNVSETTTSTSHVATSLTANITPSSTSSKILILMKAPVTNTTPIKQNNVTLYRDATDLTVGTYGMCFYYKGSTSYTWTEISMNYLDSPNTTSTVTYKCYFKARNGGTAYFGAGESSSHLTLMEIAG